MKWRKSPVALPAFAPAASSPSALLTLKTAPSALSSPPKSATNQNQMAGRAIPTNPPTSLPRFAAPSLKPRASRPTTSFFSAPTQFPKLPAANSAAPNRAAFSSPANSDAKPLPGSKSLAWPFSAFLPGPLAPYATPPLQLSNSSTAPTPWPSAILVLLCWFALLFTRNPHAASRVERAAARAILACAFIRVTLSGDTSLLSPTSSARIFAANHSSYADIILLIAVLPAGTRFVAKGETLHMPIIRTLITRAGHFAFDRRDPQARVRQADSVRDALLHRHSVAIFPEGTFTPLPGIRPFQLGTFKSAAETQTSICPISVRGARLLLRDKTWLPRHTPIEITVGPLATPLPQPPDADASWQEIVRLRDATRETIASNSGEPLL